MLRRLVLDFRRKLVRQKVICWPAGENFCVQISSVGLLEKICVLRGPVLDFREKLV